MSSAVIAARESELKLRGDESLSITVAFGSSEYPQRERCFYLGPAWDPRFHFVRRLSGDVARVHDTQLENAQAFIQPG